MKIVNFINKIVIGFILGVLMLGTYAKTVQAEESVSVLMLSKHFNAPDCIKYGTDNEPCLWNEKNIGISYNYDIGDKQPIPQIVYGMYHNSFNRLSTHIGIGYRLKYGGVVVSALTGYPMMAVLPSVVPYLEIPVISRFKVQLLVPYTPGGVQVLALQLRYVL